MRIKQNDKEYSNKTKTKSKETKRSKTKQTKAKKQTQIENFKKALTHRKRVSKAF